MQHSINSKTNCVDPDQPASSEAADLDPHYLQGNLKVTSEENTFLDSLCNTGFVI